MIRRGLLQKRFIQELNEANRKRDDPHLTTTRLVGDESKIIVASQLTEFPNEKNPTRQFQKKDLDDVLADYSDLNPNSVDLDTDPTNIRFLQKSIKSLVQRDTQLGESNINLDEGATPQLPQGVRYFEPTIVEPQE